MNCNRCGYPVPDGYGFCPRCQNPMTTPKKKKKKVWIPIVIVFSVVAILAIAGVLGYYVLFSVNPNDPVKLMAQADRKSNLKKYDEAIEIYERVIVLEPKNSDAYIGLARVYRNIAENDYRDRYYDGARNNYQSALDALDRYPNPQNTEIVVEKAQIDGNIRDLEKEINRVLANQNKPVKDKVTYGTGNGQDSGNMISIYSWNTEFQDMVIRYMPGYQATSDPDVGNLGGLDVRWVIVPTYDDAYTQAIEQAMNNDEEDIDIFLLESEDLQKYAQKGISKPLSQLGFKNLDIANQYSYTIQAVTNDGEVYGSAYSTSGEGMIYNRNIAKRVLGTDDPEEVHKLVIDWDGFYDVAQKMKAHGYQMTPSVEYIYRSFRNGVKAPWVDASQRIIVDDQYKQWAEMSKNLTENDMSSTTSMWDADNQQCFFEDSAFCVFGPMWYLNYCMSCMETNSVGYRGGWGFCEGPDAAFWGGSWVMVADKTDNNTMSAEIVRCMTMDEDILEQLARNENIEVNNRALAEKFANDSTFNNDYLGGQNPYTVLKDMIPKINAEYLTEYDYTCEFSFQDAMKPYINGKETYDDALNDFISRLKLEHPGLTY